MKQFRFRFSRYECSLSVEVIAFVVVLEGICTRVFTLILNMQLGQNTRTVNVFPLFTLTFDFVPTMYVVQWKVTYLDFLSVHNKQEKGPTPPSSGQKDQVRRRPPAKVVMGTTPIETRLPRQLYKTCDMPNLVLRSCLMTFSSNTLSL